MGRLLGSFHCWRWPSRPQFANLYYAQVLLDSGVNAAALAATADAPTLAVFAVVAVVVGLASVTVTMLAAHAATLTSDDQRARVIGTLLGGLLLGVLLARGFAGLLAGLLGWRTVYVIAAVLMTATAGSAVSTASD